MLAVCGKGVVVTREWFDGVRHGRFKFWKWVSEEEKEKEWKKRIGELKKVKEEVEEVLDRFRDVERYVFFRFSRHFC